MAPIPDRHPLRQWFAGLVEHSFQVQIGFCEPTLLDYLTELLVEFIHVERINLLTDGSGRKLEDVAAMIAEAELGDGASILDRKRTVHRHIGDFTLFWTGVYPEQLRHLRRRVARDALLNYFAQGKRSYAIASDLTDEEGAPPAAVFRRLSDRFEECVYGLALVRRSWEQGEVGDFGRINRA